MYLLKKYAIYSLTLILKMKRTSVFNNELYINFFGKIQNIKSKRRTQPSYPSITFLLFFYSISRKTYLIFKNSISKNMTYIEYLYATLGTKSFVFSHSCLRLTYVYKWVNYE